MSKVRTISSLVLSLLVLFVVTASQAAAGDEDVVHMISGVVKHVDKDGKTMVIKADDGTEHTVKWSGKTAWEGTKDAGKGLKEGSKVSVKYTEKAGEKTAVGVKDVSKDTAKALQ